MTIESLIISLSILQDRRLIIYYVYLSSCSHHILLAFLFMIVRTMFTTNYNQPEPNLLLTNPIPIPISLCAFVGFLILYFIILFNLIYTSDALVFFLVLLLSLLPKHSTWRMNAELRRHLANDYRTFGHFI